MIVKNIKYGWLFIFLCLSVLQAQAEVEWQMDKMLQLENAPIDVAVSSKNKWIFILTDENKILIYTPEGRLKDTVSPDYAVSSITPGPEDHILLLNSIEKKTVQVVSLSFVETIDTAGSPVTGNKDGLIEIVVFSDFQCPYCSRLEPMLYDVLMNNPDTVKLVFKHYPLKMHDMALKAAAASIVAFQKGKFWEVHDKLFEASNALSEEKILEIAVSAGLKKSRIQRSWTNKATYRKIFQDIEDGKKAGVDGVPKVFINGRSLKTRNIPGFQEMIDQELKGLHHQLWIIKNNNHSDYSNLRS